MARFAMTAREVAGPHRSLPPQSESLAHTSCDAAHMRSGPGVPWGLGTQVSVALAGNWQVLGGGMMQVLAGTEQVLAIAVHRLSACMLHVPAGRSHRLGVPAHGLAGGGKQWPPSGQSPSE
jgi:hypothetical protein